MNQTDKLDCKYVGVCGGCTLGDISYKEQLSQKISNTKEIFKEIYDQDISIVETKPRNFRNRIELRIFHKSGNISYAMNSKEKKIVQIELCNIAVKPIISLMPKFLLYIQQHNILKSKLFSVEFLASSIDDVLVTLIYHKKLDDTWKQIASTFALDLGIKIIGRSRKQKIVISDDFINEELTINNKQYKFQYKEGGFIQPNQDINLKMINWVLNHIDPKDDLCELYCGGGNFTIALSTKFNKVVATEISKTSIKSAKTNIALNNIDNIKFVRMSSEEFTQAKHKTREFRRLKQENINIDDYNFSTIFIDPPRAGLDNTTLDFVKEFEQIIYISCNPNSLFENLKILTQTHKIVHFAFFDQFAYTTHIESGVILQKKDL